MIRLSNVLYSIYPLGEGLHLIAEEDPSMFPPDHPVGSYEKLIQKAPPEPARAALEDDDYCVIRLIVAYTDSVAMQNFDPLSQIQLATDFTNQSHVNSEVDHQVELARVFRVSYTETWDLDTDLDRFEVTDDGIMDNVHALRDLYDADLCQLIVSGAGDGCGLASSIGSSFSDAFCVSAYGCIAGNLTYAHELGHLYNCRHDPFVDNTAGANHGYVNIPSGWRTVMAYNDACEDADTDCTRLMFWSNPDVSTMGEATGVAGANENAAEIIGYEPTIRDFQAVPAVKSVSTSETIANLELGDFVGLDRVENNLGTTITYQDGGVGAFHAGTEVLLQVGFNAEAGSNFVAYLSDPCSGGGARPLAGEEKESIEAIHHRFETDTKISPAFGKPRVYPNPHASGFQFEVDLEESGWALLEVYNLYGQKVKTLQPRQWQEAGHYHQVFSTADLPGGTYVLSFRFNGVQHQQPLIKMD